MTILSTDPPMPELARLVDRHGTRRVLAAFFAIALAGHGTRRGLRRDAGTLSNHLRKDLGLPERDTTPRQWHLP